MICNAKHTKLKPTGEEFNCPKCQAEIGDFCVDGLAEDANDDCELLHVKDNLECVLCGHRESGATFVRRLAKEQQQITCPTCKGKGTVKSPSACPVTSSQSKDIK